MQGSPVGGSFYNYENSSGFTITVTTTNKYTFTLVSTPSITEEQEDQLCLQGPVTDNTMIK